MERAIGKCAENCVDAEGNVNFTDAETKSITTTEVDPVECIGMKLQEANGDVEDIALVIAHLSRAEKMMA